jgi:nucleotide-binding universal stress UspA family protein
MTLHVLVPIDDSDPAEAALSFALSEHPDETITVLHVAETTSLDSYQTMTGGRSADADEAIEGRTAEAEALLDRARETASDRGVEIETELIAGDPADAIPAYAEANEVDRIVIGTHGRSAASRLLVGSVAEAVIRAAPIPVTVVE